LTTATREEEEMSRRRIAGGVAAALLVGALVVAVPVTAKGAGGLGISGAAPDSSSVTGPPGTDASTLRYAAIPSGSATTVLAIETQGGAIRRQRSLAGRWALPAVTLRGDAGGLSADGEALVLTRRSYRVSDSSFRVLDGRSLRLEERIALDGRFVFDAISPDGRVMYLIEYPGRNNFTEYRVRAYDIARGELRRNAVIDPDEAGEQMTGEPYARAMSPDGRWAYTLYGGEETFVHALDTQEATAVCIVLSEFEKANLLKLGLAVDPEGGAITVLDGGDPAAVIDPQTFQVESPPAGGATGASEAGSDWAIWALVGGGLVLCAAVFALQRRRRHRAAVEAELEDALREDPAPSEDEESRPREPVA
jgi:hypothetical protein